MIEETESKVPKPPWIRVRIPSGEKFKKVRTLVHDKGLHTVCAEALCPNLAECWSRGTATFLIMGGICTRDCNFCGVRSGPPAALNPDEPSEVAEAVEIMRLKHAVITSVTRDDLPDGGAAVFAETIRSIRRRTPECRIEVLVPDFQGSPSSIATVIDSGPDVFAHNIETVPRLYPRVRRQADYLRSLNVLATAHKMNPNILTKSGFMVGLGERWEEVLQAMADLYRSGCRILTVGQYLRPTKAHLPVIRYYSPREFDLLKGEGYRAGFRHVESGPLVRSSYHAESQTGIPSSEDPTDNG